MNHDDNAASEVWKAIKAQPIAMMTTMHDDAMISRPMAAHADADEGAIYFVSRLESGKTHDIDMTSAVNLSFCDPANATYISVTGHATVSQDRKKLRELWNMWAEAWLPDGPDAPDTTLITVDPGEAVLWDSNSSRIVRTIKTVAAAITQTPPDMGRERKVVL